MEKEEKDILKKIRSSRACISDGYQLFTGNFRKLFRMTWPVALGFAVISAIASALPVLLSPTLVWPALALEALAVIVYLYLSNRILHKRSFLEKTEKASAAGWMRHLGMVLLVGIVCLFIVAILTLFTSLPSIIMMAANWESQMGVMNGDPLGMPSYVMWLSIGAFLLAGFLQAYIWLTTICPMYLAKTSIVLQEQERKALYNEKS
ncbi:MAG: hypothetical protein IKM77_05960 [Prevotella sp.]|nr:hypothetical protein [Prevotella sp.]